MITPSPEPAGANSSTFPEPSVVRAQLHRLKSSPVFSPNLRRTQMLEYLVNRTLAGESAQITEYGIGLDVFGRPPSFDPRLESVVRAEASRLRQKLRDYYSSAGRADPVLIEIPSRSYVPEITVRSIETRPAETAEPFEPPRHRRAPWAWAAAAIVIIAGVSLVTARLTREPAPPASIAVLPFQDLSAGKQYGYLADGVTEELTNELAQIRDLHVVARTSATQFKGKGWDVREIGRKLNTAAVLEGSVARSETSVRITAQLNRTSDGYHLWSRAFETSPDGVLAVEGEVADAVAGVLRKPGSGPVRNTLAGIDPEAHELFLRANSELALVTPQSAEAAAGLFRRATEVDPKYTAAYIGLARAEISAIHFTAEAPKENLERTREALQHAIDLDPASAEAHGLMGLLDYNYDWNWPQAEREYRTALQQADIPSVHSYYGLGLATRGRFSEAQEHFRMAQDLDPLGVAPAFNGSIALMLEHKYKEADTALVGLLRVHPDILDARLFRGLMAFLSHDCRQAHGEFEWAASHYHMPVTSFGMALATGCAGDRAGALKYLKQMEAAPPPAFASPYQLALGYAMLGDTDSAIAWLRKSADVKEGQILYIKYEPFFDGIRTDPRFQELLRRVGLNL